MDQKVSLLDQRRPMLNPSDSGRHFGARNGVLAG